MEMHEIRYFLALCETLNFRRAAEQCNVSQPSLTRAIQKLEEELAGSLFRREGRMTDLTALGRLVRPQFQEILDRSAATLELARKQRSLDHESLRLGAMCTLSPSMIAHYLTDCREKFPGIDITLHDGPPEELSALLMAEEIDVALMAQPEPFGGMLRARTLFTERFVLAFAMEHPFAAKQVVTWHDIADQRVLAQINCEYRNFFAGLLKQRGAMPQMVYQTVRADWIQALVVEDYGICILPEYSVMTEGVLTLPVLDPEVVRAVSLVTVAGRRHAPVVVKFIRHATTYRWPSMGRAVMASSGSAAD
ncbi:MAG: LysR family transcriptional regulator [Aliidongia sp.]